MGGAAERDAGEARIARAFRVSLAVGGFVAVGAALLWWSGRDVTPPVVPKEVTIAAPVQRAPVERLPSAPPAIPFTDITTSAGIDFVHVNGAYGDKLIPETMGGGLAFFEPGLRMVAAAHRSIPGTVRATLPSCPGIDSATGFPFVEVVREPWCAANHASPAMAAPARAVSKTARLFMANAVSHAQMKPQVESACRK